MTRCVSACRKILTRRRPRSLRLATLVATAFFAGVICPPSARAHDPYQSWASAIVRADHMELTVTMAPSTALRVLGVDLRVTPTITREMFPAHHARLAAAASALCTFTSGKTTLTARKAEAVFTDEDDITFTVVYPRPRSGPLRIHAAFLVRLGGDYGSILEVADNSGNHLGWDQLNADQPNLEVTVRPPVMPGKS